MFLLFLSVGTVCGIDIYHLYNRSVQQNKAQIITGHYTFQPDVAMATNVTVLGNISGYHLEVEVDAMVLTTDVTVNGTFIFVHIL